MGSLSEEDKLLALRKQVNSTLSFLRKRNKASTAELNHNGARGGRFSARSQTLYANSYKTARVYDSSMKDLKEMFKYL